MTAARWLAGLAIALAATAPSGPIGAAEHAVTMGDNLFWSTSQRSSTTTIRVGDTVTWENRGDAPHNAVADDGSWRSPTLGPGGTFSRTFTTPGEYAYACTLHLAEEMFGKVVVLGDTPTLPFRIYLPHAAR